MPQTCNSETMTTYHTEIIDGIPVSFPNVTENANGYYVSYNDYDRRIYGCDTTAIVITRTNAFLILNGDHREKLRGLSLEDACKYFHANADNKNKLSDDHEDDVLREVNGKWQMMRLPK